MVQPLAIDVAFDLVCPWCYIGKRNLAQAEEKWGGGVPERRVEKRWHSVQLIPGVPEEGIPFAEFYERRLGGPERARARQAQVREAARASGLAIEFERIRRFPNSARAHRVLAFARDGGAAPAQHEALLERLFEAYFVRGEDIGDRETLLAIGAEHGLEREALAAWITPAEMPSGSASIEQIPSGVPFFVFDQRFAVSGAQPPEVLAAAMAKAAEE